MTIFKEKRLIFLFFFIIIIVPSRVVVDGFSWINIQTTLCTMQIQILTKLFKISKTGAILFKKQKVNDQKIER
jgi:hypothetical protein